MKFAIRQVQELVQLKKERSAVEEERDLFFRQLETARQQLQQQEAQLLLRKKDIQDVKDKQHTELKIYRQRANHLKYEASKEAESENGHQEALAREALKQRVSERAEIAREAMYVQRKAVDEEQAFLQNAKENATKMALDAKDFADNLREALASREEWMAGEWTWAAEEAALDGQMVARRAEQQRGEHIHHLQANYERNFTQVKRYFQELTQHNLQIISQLSTRATTVRQHVRQLAARLQDIRAQNRRCRLPMQAKQAQLTTLRQQLANLRKDEAAAQRTQRELQRLQADRRTLKTEITGLQEQLTKLQEETKQWQAGFVPASSEAKGIIGAQANDIRDNTVALKERVQKVKEEIRQQILAKNLDAQQFLDQVEIFEKKCLENTAIRNDLHQSIQKMAKVYNDSLQTIRYLVEEFHLPLDASLDRRPIQPATVTLLAGKAAEINRLRQVKHALTPARHVRIKNAIF
ncbi:dynein regulatory complex subunit 4-like isoform X2 [Paramacrobiotus metropolitanus]|nr:dynein regulatory complex subunit 4-like isoform X2 [Paramacrobiotus metropolitanus]